MRSLDDLGGEQTHAKMKYVTFLETIGWRLTMHALVSIRDALVALQSETRGSTRRNVC